MLPKPIIKEETLTVDHEWLIYSPKVFILPIDTPTNQERAYEICQILIKRALEEAKLMAEANFWMGSYASALDNIDTIAQDKINRAGLIVRQLSVSIKFPSDTPSKK